MSAQEPHAAVAPPFDSAFAQWCADESLVEDITAPHGEAFTAGFRGCSAAVLEISARSRRDEQPAAAVPTLEDVRDLLNELHYTGDGGGCLESSDYLEAERVIRWLLNAYLRRGTHVCNDEPAEADRVA